MASRYDSRTTTFSPEGSLYQVHYAMEAIGKAGSAVGILTSEGCILTAEKRITSKLLDIRDNTEKMFKIDDHVACAVAGITADANTLINYARLEAQRYRYAYQEPIPIEQLLQRICDLKQGYTQYGGLRPFGVAFIFAGWDRHFGYQLYKSDPSGNYGGWKAAAIGANSESAESVLKSDYKVGEVDFKTGMKLAVKVMNKTMDTNTPSPEKLEFATISRGKDGKIIYHTFPKAEIEGLLKEVGAEKAAGDV